MAITITTEADFTVTTTSQAAVAANAGRRALTMQNQSQGNIWIKLSGAASVDDGMRIGPGERVGFDGGLGKGQGTGSDFYVGVVNAIYEPLGRDGAVVTGILHVLDFE